MIHKIQQVLEQNRDGNLSEKGFRDMLAQEIARAIGPRSGGIGSTVMTPEASAYNPKTDGPNGPKPQSM